MVVEAARAAASTMGETKGAAVDCPIGALDFALQWAGHAVPPAARLVPGRGPRHPL